MAAGAQQPPLSMLSLTDCATKENQWVKMGAHHTLEIELNNKLTLGKDWLRHGDSR